MYWLILPRYIYVLIYDEYGANFFTSAPFLFIYLNIFLTWSSNIVSISGL